MDKSLADLDWSRVQAFLAVAETGSLSAAARQLEVSQPTLGRQIKALEAELTVTLFTRQPRGLALTETGAALLAPARAMAQAAGQMAMAAAGRAETMAGTVRISASVTVALHMLPKTVASIRRQEPEIQIEIASTDEVENLLFREADIAIRMYRPEQLDVVTRHIGNMNLGLYCTRDYLGNRPIPETVEEVLAHDLVGYDKIERIIRGLRDFGYQVDRSWFAARCDDHNVLWGMICEGCGIGFIPTWMGDARGDMLRVGSRIPIPPLELWLTAHEAMRQTPRIRRVWDILVEELSPQLDPI